METYNAKTPNSRRRRSRRDLRTVTSIALVLLLVPFVAAPAQASTIDDAPQEVREAIGKGNAAFSAAFEKGDTEALAALYTEDAVLLPPGNRGRQQGRPAIARFFTLPASVQMVDHKLTTISLEVKGDTVIETGQWTSVTRRNGGEPQEYTGPYLLVWERTADGRWLIDYDMWQSPPSE